MARRTDETSLNKSAAPRAKNGVPYENSSLCPSAHYFLNRIVLFLVLLLVASVIDSSAQTNEDSANQTREGPSQPAFISGQVVDFAGRPISEFEYLVRGGAMTENLRVRDGSLLRLNRTSHPRGEFRKEYHEGLGAKQTVVVGAPGYVTRYHVFEPGAGDSLTDMRIVLDKAASVEGTVVDTRGNPVSSALIWIGAVPRPGRHGRPGHIAETNADGRFLSDRFPPDATTLGVLHPDHPAASVDINLSLLETNQLTLLLPRGVILSGSMSFGEMPVRDGRVNVTTKEGGKAVVPTNGIFSIKGVPVEATDVLFRTFRSESTGQISSWDLRKRVELTDRDELNVDIRFPAGTATLSGQLLLDGEAVGTEYGSALYATLVDETEKLQITAFANDEGRFSISDMPEGDWDISVQLYDTELGGFNSRQPVTTRAGTITTLNIDFPLNDK